MDTDVRQLREEPTSAEMHARAREYRLMAATATTAKVRDALLAMVRMLERGAAANEPEGTA